MKSPFQLLIVVTLLASSIFSSCKKEGCTDKTSHTFDAKAEEDDGSCKYYYGGKYFGQLDVGSQMDMNNEFDIYFDGVLIGRSRYYFPNGLNCGNAQAVGKIISSGSHTIRAVGNGGSPVREGNITLNPQECKVVLIENLSVVGGGGGSVAGYNCMSGNCVYVNSGATYATSASCQNNCGGSSTGSLMFWVNQDLGCGNIYVTIPSYGSSTISSYYSMTPNCGASGCANFSNLGYGAYSYSVTSDGSCTWYGNIQLNGSCQTIQLTL